MVSANTGVNHWQSSTPCPATKIQFWALGIPVNQTGPGIPKIYYPRRAAAPRSFYFNPTGSEPLPSKARESNLSPQASPVRR